VHKCTKILLIVPASTGVIANKNSLRVTTFRHNKFVRVTTIFSFSFTITMNAYNHTALLHPTHHYRLNCSILTLLSMEMLPVTQQCDDCTHPICNVVSKCFHGMIMRILGIFTFARRIASHLKQSQPRLELISYRLLTTTSLNLCQGTHYNLMYNFDLNMAFRQNPSHSPEVILWSIDMIFTSLYITKLTCNCAVDRDDRSHKMNIRVERTSLFCHVILPGRSLQGTFPYPLLLWYEHIILTSLLTHQKA
jgi:hypothetical protein